MQLKFTGKERDSETNLDYFLARYYSSAQGRFTTPDEFRGGIVDPFTGKDIVTNTALPYADITDPQTLNKYAYVRNNPLRYVDPDGHDAIWVTGAESRQETLVIPVHFTGAGATPDKIADIVSRANTLDTGGSPVQVLVVPTDRPVLGVLNRMDFSPGHDSRCGSAGECVINGLGGDKAHIDSRPSSGTDAAAHDVLHFAGIRDQYTEGQRDANGNRTSKPKPGYDSSNIMTSRRGQKLKPEQIQEAKRNGSTKHCSQSSGGTTCNWGAQ